MDMNTEQMVSLLYDYNTELTNDQREQIAVELAILANRVDELSGH